MLSSARTTAAALKDTACTPGYCLKVVRTWLGVPFGARSAAEAWALAEGKHKGDRQPPKGAPVFWTGGSRGYGHIALSLGDGRIRSTDMLHAGDVGTVELGEVEHRWGLHYAGWAETLNGQRVIAKPKAPAKPKLLNLAPGVVPNGRDPQVEVLQRLLIDAGYGPIPHAFTQHYGKETQAAVVRFHAKHPEFASGPRDRAIGPKGFEALQHEAAAK